MKLWPNWPWTESNWLPFEIQIPRIYFICEFGRETNTIKRRVIALSRCTLVSAFILGCFRDSESVDGNRVTFSVFFMRITHHQHDHELLTCSYSGCNKSPFPLLFVPRELMREVHIVTWRVRMRAYSYRLRRIWSVALCSVHNYNRKSLFIIFKNKFIELING